MSTVFRFVGPGGTGEVIDIEIQAWNLTDAFNAFVERQPEVSAEIAVWRERTLCGRIAIEHDHAGKISLKLIDLAPVHEQFPRTYACGD